MGEWMDEWRKSERGEDKRKQRVIDFCRGFARRYIRYIRDCADPQGTPGGSGGGGSFVR